ncbi:hypothetical protein HDU87_001850 [Geranomyces variabilis]|uniref:Uncharacterized protein n=1 Tax=Geranomyces variabilis TaxID=109894 RepID=A0AAD5XSG8_9FUNG|nr:hypothetical protein HDU87_001850 [Geranomyces variabilis]
MEVVEAAGEHEAKEYWDSQGGASFWNPDANGAVFDHYDENTASRAHCSWYSGGDHDAEYPEVPVYDMGNLSTYYPHPLEQPHYVSGMEIESDARCYSPMVSQDAAYGIGRNLGSDDYGEGDGLGQEEFDELSSTEGYNCGLEGTNHGNFDMTEDENRDRAFWYPRHRLH